MRVGAIRHCSSGTPIAACGDMSVPSAASFSGAHVKSRSRIALGGLAALGLSAAGLGAAVLSVAAFANDARGHRDPGGADEAHAGAPGEWALFEQYCNECHNSVDWAGGVAFDILEPQDVAADPHTWEETVRKLRGRLMPPPDKPQPDHHAVDALVAWLETRLDETARRHPNPGSVVLHRLNRTEYARAIEDMLALKIDAAALLPRDTKSEGFDNVASVLRVSPSFLDQYIAAAREVSIQAVGPAAPAPSSTVYRGGLSGQLTHVEGLPLGTRGGMLIEHNFPVDGEYVFNINSNAGTGGGYITGLDERHKMIMTVDGKKVFETEIGGEEDLKAVDQRQAVAAKEIQARYQNIRLPMQAGPRRIGIAFVARTLSESEEPLRPLNDGAFGARMPAITGLEVVGPFAPAGISETPSRQRIFICRPADASEELPCAERILSNLARRAYRRPVSAEDLAAPMRFYRTGRESGDFETGIQHGLMAILASPKFLYRVEQVPQDAAPGTIYAISDIELASRLSFFLWSQGPDEALLQVAEAGKLRDPQVLEAQIARMLADPRSSSLVTNFAAQWLQVDKLDEIDPDPNLFPEFDESLRAAYRREMELFVDSILREDRSVLDLLTAGHTFVNERLAQHYGIPNVRGSRFRRVELGDAPHLSARRGLLGKGSILLVTSYANRTAPVLRGAFILENITATPPAAPPPGVETLKENQEGQQARTIRELMVLHREEPSCNSCHGIMDPLGLALENFDAIGGWRDRDRDAGVPIDASGEVFGAEITGPDDLRAVLTARPEQFAQALTEKLMIYALGRGVEHHDMPAVRAIVREAARQDYRFSAIVTGIVKSDPFNLKMIPDETEGQRAAVHD
ncbi:MAG: hypothetical protein DIU71_05650 [Proteobacteria bacterium]|nr:MAG: hypothetical protein DIU71_05650 [Pseudomonadota bacterium]